MDTQNIINIAIGVIGTLGGWVLKSVKDNIKSLQEADTALAEKIQNIEVLVAGHYVHKSDLEKLTTALFAKLDKIEDKLDKKVDK